MIKAYSSAARLSVSCSISRSQPTRCSSSVTQSRISVSSLLNRETASLGGSTHNLVTINGFVRSIRKQKRVAFAAIGDGTSLEPLQAVLTPEQANGLSPGTAVRLTGSWEASPSGKEQTHELKVQRVKALGDNDASNYPIQNKYHTVDFLRTLPHLRSRLPYNSLLLRLRSLAISCATSFFSQEGYVQTHPPLITSSDCEGAGEVFTIDSSAVIQAKSGASGILNSENESFFRSTKYLTVSSQLHLEALAQSVGNVWTLSPTFRAEKSETPRHLSEFYMLEAETAFVDNLIPVMDLVERLLRAITRTLADSQTGKELLTVRSNQIDSSERHETTRDELEARWNGLLSGPWPRITYAEAISTLQNAVSERGNVFEYPPTFGVSLQAEHEKYLAKHLGQGSPVFVTDYPRDIKAFYMAPSKPPPGTQDPQPTVACFDLLVPEICEIVGGSIREHRLPQLLESMERHGLLKDEGSDNVAHSITTPDGVQDTRVPSNLQWYLDLRRFSSVPHGGFGLGFDRLLCYLSGVSNIREIVAFPRWYGRCDC